MSDLDSLIDSVTESNHGCWRQKLKGDALMVVEAIEQRTNGNPKRSELADVLNKLGNPVKAFSIGHHYRGSCSCP